jgi:hypothetical protein
MIYVLNDDVGLGFGSYLLLLLVTGAVAVA